MSILKCFFDTETTGKADFIAKVDDPCQPHMVSCAAVLTDEACNEIASFRFICQPSERESDKGALEVHGIDRAMAQKCGLPRLTVLSAFYNLAKLADEHIAFNYDFDCLVLTGEFLRAKKPSPFTPEKAFCEMKAMTPICKIPSPYRAGQFKWPNLQEAHKHATGQGFDNAHDAMADVRAMIAVHRWRLAQMGAKPKTAAPPVPVEAETA